MASDDGDSSRHAAEATLRLLDPRLANLIRQGAALKERLRRYACACADSAVRDTGVHEEVLTRALAYAGTVTSSESSPKWEQMREQVSEVVERLDDAAFHAQTAQDEGIGTDEEYLDAFRAARAASSVLACLGSSSLLAATEACYEAVHAGVHIDVLTRLAETMLSS